ncbi:MAG: hypothetical protein QXV83_04160 [Candidatus Anstonellaceae archaeon]
MSIKFDFQYSKISNNFQSSSLTKYKNYLLKILKNKKNFFDKKESFLCLPFYKKTISQCKKLDKLLNPDLMIVIGIGGSNLGAWCVYNSIYGRYAELLEKKILFADSPEPLLIKKILDICSTYIKEKKKICLVFISKSGTTLESVANFKILYSFLKSSSPHIDIVFISSSSHFDRRKLKQLNFHFLKIPQAVVGRYSVFSVAGVFPLVYCGIDVESLFSGAQKATLNILQKEPQILYNWANFIYSNYPAKNIFVSFLFSSSLEKYGMWHNQLFAESLSKNLKGLTPIFSIGPMDLHSMAQLYFGGPKDKIFSLLSIKRFDYDEVFSSQPAIFSQEDIFTSKPLSHVYNSIFRGVKQAFISAKLPFVSIELEKLDEFHLGYLMQCDMLKTIFCAKLAGVNAFDQPAVELYKSEVKKFL